MFPCIKNYNCKFFSIDVGINANLPNLHPSFHPKIQDRITLIAIEGENQLIVHPRIPDFFAWSVFPCFPVISNYTGVWDRFILDKSIIFHILKNNSCLAIIHILEKGHGQTSFSLLKNHYILGLILHNILLSLRMLSLDKILDRKVTGL